MANGSLHCVYAVKETEYGVTPSDPALDQIRITSISLGLNKDSLQSSEIRCDRQMSDFRLGSNQVAGDIGFELSCDSFDDFLQGVLMSTDWTSPATTGTTTIDATASGYERATGSFLDDGFSVGQTVTASGFTGSGYNGESVITAVTALTMTTTPVDGTHGAETGGGDELVLAAESISAGTERSSFTFVRNFTDIDDKPYYIYRGVEFNSVQLTISANSIITGTLSTIGQSHETAVDLTDLGTPTYNDVSETEPLDSFTGTINEGGSTIAVVTEISLTLQNGIEPRFVVGSKDSIYPSVGDSNLTGQITAYFEDSTLVDKFLDEEDSSLTFRLPDSDGNMQRYRIPRIKYTGGQPDVSGTGPIILTMPFQALLDPDEDTNILIERVTA